MKCGEFNAKARSRVVIQARTDTVDSYGGASVAWSTLATVWAIIEPASGREFLQSNQLQSRTSHKITIRYQSSLKNTASAAKNRISFDDRLFSVKYIKNLDEDMKREGKAFQQLYCEENDAEN